MKRKNIAVDIDATLTNYDKFMTEVAEKYYPDREVDLTLYHISNQFQFKNIEEKKVFLNTIFKDYLINVEIFKGAVDIIKELHKYHNIHVVTNRGYKEEKEDTLEQEITVNWLKRNNVEYDTINFNISTKDKTDILKELDIDLVIDDAEFQLKNIKEKLPNVKLLAHTTLSNAKFLQQYTKEELPRFTDWNNDTLELIKKLLK